MKTKSKKLVGGLLVGMLIATIGAAFATGQPIGTTKDMAPTILVEGRQGMIEKGSEMITVGSSASGLTDAQQTELNKLITSLVDQKATPEQIQAAIQEKLGEYGIPATDVGYGVAQLIEPNATIGGAFVPGQTIITNGMIKEGRGIVTVGSSASGLTDAQQTEIGKLITSLIDQQATPEEIQAAIQKKLNEYGVPATQVGFSNAQIVLDDSMKN